MLHKATSINPHDEENKYDNQDLGLIPISKKGKTVKYAK